MIYEKFMSSDVKKNIEEEISQLVKEKGIVYIYEIADICYKHLGIVEPSINDFLKPIHVWGE